MVLYWLVVTLLWGRYGVAMVCFDIQIMFNLEKAHFILDEMVMNGNIVETNKISILKPIHLMEKAS